MLDQRVVLVTGGARGLGAAIVTAVAEAGGIPIIGDIRHAQAQALVRELQARKLAAASTTLDVTDEDSVRACIDGIRRTHERLDAIVNNAGIDITLPIDELETGRWEQVLRTNLHGPFLLAKHGLDALKTSRGHLINIASTAAKRAWPNAAAYHASKWGLMGLSQALHAELRPHGIRVTAVVAGGMRTPFLLERFPDLDPELLQDPADVARAVVFALSAPAGSVVAEIMVLPVRESSWP